MGKGRIIATAQSIVERVSRFRVLFVCVGNVCRSPLGHLLLAARLPGDRFDVASAGVGAIVDEPMSPEAAIHLEPYGITAEGFSSRQLTPAMVDESDLLLAATKDVRSRILEESPAAMRRTFTVLEFAALLDLVEPGAGPAELVAHAADQRSRAVLDDYDIPDPFRRGPACQRDGRQADVHGGRADREGTGGMRARIVVSTVILAVAVAPSVATAQTAPRPDVPRRPSTVSTAPPLRGVTIALDPGHQLGNHNYPRETNRMVPAGGFKKPCNTTGTSTNSGVAEATVNFRLSRAVKRRLEKLGAVVKMTRNVNSEHYWGPCVNVRGAFGKRVHARLMVSLHADGAGSVEPRVPRHRADQAESVDDRHLRPVGEARQVAA